MRDRRFDARGWRIPNALESAFCDENNRRYLLMYVFACETGKTDACFDWTAATSEPFRGGFPPVCPHCKQDMTARREPYREYFRDDEPTPGVWAGGQPGQAALFGKGE